MEDLEKKKEAFAELLEVIATLRVECPWDRKQTMESLRALSIEEVYELGDAILAGDMAEVKKELGDLLMHIVFYAQIGSEKEAFDITDVLNSICEKLKYRHPRQRKNRLERSRTGGFLPPAERPGFLRLPSTRHSPWNTSCSAWTAPHGQIQGRYRR